MKIHWSLNSVPELAELPPDERLMVHRACLKQLPRRTKFFTIALCCGAASILGPTLSLLFGALFNLLPSSPLRVAIGAGITITLAGPLLMNPILIAHLRSIYPDYIRRMRENPAT